MVAGLHLVTISFGGFAGDHNWMRGHPESYDPTLNTIKMLVYEPELVWDVVTCVNRRNYSHLEEMKEYLYSIGDRQWRLFSIFPVGRATRHPEFQLTDEEFTCTLEFFKWVRKRGKMNQSFGCEGFLGKYEDEVHGSFSDCPSLFSHFHQGNIYQDDFMEVWENRFQMFRNREWMKKGACADCDFFRYCEGNGMHLRDEAGELLFCHLESHLTPPNLN